MMDDDPEATESHNSTSMKDLGEESAVVAAASKALDTTVQVDGKTASDTSVESVEENIANVSSPSEVTEISHL